MGVSIPGEPAIQVIAAPVVPAQVISAGNAPSQVYGTTPLRGPQGPKGDIGEGLRIVGVLISPAQCT